MARSSVYVGLGGADLGVIMGFVWEHRLSGGYSLGDPKVVITLAILVAYVAYLRLSHKHGWRGARAAKLCALNFAGGALQLHVCEFVSDEVSSLLLDADLH